MVFSFAVRNVQVHSSALDAEPTKNRVCRAGNDRQAPRVPLEN